MGEYEDRYPEAYGRGEDIAQPPAGEELRHPMPPRQVRDAPLLRGRLGIGAAAETAPAWRHGRDTGVLPPTAPLPGRRPETEGVAMVEPTAPVRRRDGTFRGFGPRGYVRPAQRIYEDICDRLTENPFIDASDIEVRVTGAEVTLSGTVDSAIALRQAESIAEEVAGVSHVRNDLAVRSGGPHETTPGDQVNRAIGPPGRAR